jgi:hypothetical protein
MTARIEKVIEEVKALTVDEQRELRDALDQLLTTANPQLTEEEFERRLLERGVIRRIPPPIIDLTPYKNRKLMEVRGKPLSETIIEERR